MIENDVTKGPLLEELVRSYFNRAGYFAIRGVPFFFNGEEITDIDCWLYERPNGFSRKIGIVDMKNKAKPKALERILWTKGLCEVLKADEAYVVTTDSRLFLRHLCNEIGIKLIDGNDINRLKSSKTISKALRITEEKIAAEIKQAEAKNIGSNLSGLKREILLALPEGIGAASASCALSVFKKLAKAAINSQPNSDLAKITTRLSYLAVSIFVLSIDYLCAELGLRTSEEKQRLIFDAVKYGTLSSENGKAYLKRTKAFIENYGPNGHATAKITFDNFECNLDEKGAEIIAKSFGSWLGDDKLFQIARALEERYATLDVACFDMLENDEKSVIGVLLDYCEIDRARYANSIDCHKFTKNVNVVDGTPSIDEAQPKLI